MSCSGAASRLTCTLVLTIAFTQRKKNKISLLNFKGSCKLEFEARTKRLNIFHNSAQQSVPLQASFRRTAFVAFELLWARLKCTARGELKNLTQHLFIAWVQKVQAKHISDGMIFLSVPCMLHEKHHSQYSRLCNTNSGVQSLLPLITPVSVT